MKPELIKEHLQINTKPENRKLFTQLLLFDDEILSNVVNIAGEKNSKTSSKASRALEFVVQKSIDRILPFLEDIFKISKESNNDSVIRPMAKILEIITLAYFYENSTVYLSEEQLQQITSICFEWMITEQKIATQAYTKLNK